MRWYTVSSDDTSAGLLEAVIIVGRVRLLLYNRVEGEWGSRWKEGWCAWKRRGRHGRSSCGRRFKDLLHLAMNY